DHTQVGASDQPAQADRRQRTNCRPCRSLKNFFPLYRHLEKSPTHCIPLDTAVGIFATGVPAKRARLAPAIYVLATNVDAHSCNAVARFRSDLRLLSRVEAAQTELPPADEPSGKLGIADLKGDTMPRTRHSAEGIVAKLRQLSCCRLMDVGTQMCVTETA